VRDDANQYPGRMSVLDLFSAQTREWFASTFDAPTPAQEHGWPAIASGEHTLIQAPTGSGKTLAAFLYGIDRLNPAPGVGLRLLYVSPLKALNYDVERNLRGPLAGLRSELAVAVRTGDTPAKERAAMLRKPPDILITTPESFFLLLTSRARGRRRRPGLPAGRRRSCRRRSGNRRRRLDGAARERRCRLCRRRSGNRRRGQLDLDLAVDLPGAPPVGRRAPLDDRVRQQPS